MKLSFHGAARFVTGSRHLIETSSSRVLLDCGLFQGRREEAARQNRDLGFDPQGLSAVLLSHAHIDHSVQARCRCWRNTGFPAKWISPEPRPISRPSLQDAARIQESDCSHVNKKERCRGPKCVRPFFDSDDVESITRQFVGSRYHDVIKLGSRVTASFHEVGHILASAAG